MEDLMRGATVPLPLAGAADPLWQRLVEEAEAVVRDEPSLASLVVASVLNQPDLSHAIAHRVAMRLGGPDCPASVLAGVFGQLLDGKPELHAAMRRDLAAVLDRDPATERLIDPVLFFKGFHALQAHRFAHGVWRSGRRDMALLIQDRSSQVFQTDIHPAARIGSGVFLDHATGLVIGETAVVEDDVSILQAVTLGGTGKRKGRRHPTIRSGVLLGAGATVIGDIEVGSGARVAAGSVVLRSVLPNTTVAGVPAKVVGGAGTTKPAHSMDQFFEQGAYETFAYTI
jgi:serine O-acetyltransferase